MGRLTTGRLVVGQGGPAVNAKAGEQIRFNSPPRLPMLYGENFNRPVAGFEAMGVVQVRWDP